MSRCGQLSGGERARLSLALITREAPHILILDEPTNHLDVEARDALVEALAEFGGAVVVVSHDRHLLGLIADRLLLVDDGTATEFDGSLDDYRDMVLGVGRRPSGRTARSRPSAATARPSGGSRPRRASATGLAQASLAGRGRGEAAVRSGAPRSTRCSPRRSAMAAPSVSELMKTRAEVERNLAAAEHRWLEASEAAERARAERSTRG